MFNLQNFRTQVYKQLEPSAWLKEGVSSTNMILVSIILVASVAAILETEPLLSKPYAIYFNFAEIFFGSIFLIEYLARIWSLPDQNGNPWMARLKFIFSPSGLIDVAVIAASILPIATANVSALRLLRLIRIVRLAKLGRLSAAMKSLDEAIYSRRYELGMTVGLAIGLLIFGASALYWLEGELQPDKFGSVPRALWWAVITMTTIGYGDVYPITVGGKIVAAFVAVAGIGLIAMPTGILAAAFSDAMQKREDSEPH